MPARLASRRGPSRGSALSIGRRRAAGPSLSRAFSRLARYSVPYLGALVAALALAGVYHAARSGRLVLLKPLTDRVLLEPQRAPDDLSWPGWDDLADAARWALASFAVGDAAPEPGPPAPAPAPASPPPGDAAPAAAPAPGLAAPAPATEPPSLREWLWLLLLGGTALHLLMPISRFGKDYAVEYAMGRTLVDLQQALCGKLLTLPLSFHQALRRGDALTRILNDTLHSHNGLRVLFGQILQDAIALAVYLAWAIAISWQLSSIALLVGVPIAAVVAGFGGPIRRAARRRQESAGHVAQRFLQILGGAKVIKAFRAEDRERAAFGRANWRYFRRSLRTTRSRVASRSVVEGLVALTTTAVVAAGVVFVVRGQFGVTPGDLIAFTLVMMGANSATRRLSHQWTQLQDAVPSARRLFEVLDTAIEPAAEAAISLSGVGIAREVRCRNVSFSYGRESVLEDVSFAIPVGEVVALVGPTGSGKTTLADLLLGLRRPTRGRIEVDGIDLARIDRESFLERVAVVTQEPFLFDATIRENVLYGQPGASAAAFAGAVRAARVDEFALALPEGYDTAVGEDGVQLSGGQRQRVSIARALIKDPALLIFDEATSALDAVNERLVQEAVDALLVGRCVLLIAHRLSTVRRAARIVVLDRGRVAQSGTHGELLARGGLYRDFVSLQSDGDAPPPAPHQEAGRRLEAASP